MKKTRINGFSIAGPPRWKLFFFSIAKQAGINLRKITPDWNEEYGDILTIHRFGSPLMIQLCNYDLIKEAFVKKGDYFNCGPRTLWLVNQIFQRRGNCYMIVTF